MNSSSRFSLQAVLGLCLAFFLTAASSHAATSSYRFSGPAANGMTFVGTVTLQVGAEPDFLYGTTTNGFARYYAYTGKMITSTVSLVDASGTTVKSVSLTAANDLFHESFVEIDSSSEFSGFYVQLFVSIDGVYHFITFRVTGYDQFMPSTAVPTGAVTGFTDGFVSDFDEVLASGSSGGVITQVVASDLEVLLTQIAQLQSQIAAANTQVFSLQSQLSAANAQVSSLQSQLTAADVQVSNVQTQLSAANSQVTSLQSQLSAANAQVAQLNTEKAALQNQLSSTQTALAAANAANASLTATNATLTTQNQQLAAQVAAGTTTATTTATGLAASLGLPSLPGTTTAEQLQNLVAAVNTLNPGQKKALSDKLTGKK
jgi:hypothetical protein